MNKLEYIDSILNVLYPHETLESNSSIKPLHICIYGKNGIDCNEKIHRKKNNYTYITYRFECAAIFKEWYANRKKISKVLKKEFFKWKYLK